MVDVEPLVFLLNGKKEIVIAEIGVYKGGSTQFILDRFDIQRYYAIDPFLLYNEYYEGSIINHFKEKGEDGAYLEVLNRLSKYENVVFIRDYSHNAVQFVKDGELDVCFIDGNHAFEYVKQDIEDWFPKVKEGGILAGDDIMVDDVKRAVFEHFRLLEYDVWQGKRNWFVIKKKIPILVKREVIAFIPARKNSKRLPGKNKRLFCGKPLICWTIEAVIKCDFFDEIVIFTDDEDIVEICQQYHYDPRILLKREENPLEEGKKAWILIKEALGIEGNPIIVYLQPTSPLRTSEDITLAYNYYLKTGNGLVPGYWNIYEKSIFLNGAIFIMLKQEILFNQHVMVQNPVVYIFPSGKRIDIDTEGDFITAEKLMEERLKDE